MCIPLQNARMHFCNKYILFVFFFLLQVTFQINFDYSLDNLKSLAEVKFEAKRYRGLFTNYSVTFFSSDNVKRCVTFAAIAERRTRRTMIRPYPFLCNTTWGLFYPSEFYLLIYLFYFHFKG